MAALVRVLRCEISGYFPKYFASRSLSSLVERDVKSPRNTEIPIIIPSQTIQRLYIVKPSAQVHDPHKVAQWITKSYLHNELPSSMSTRLDISEEERKTLMSRFRDCLLQTAGHLQPMPRKNLRYEHYAALGMIPDLLKMCWPHADSANLFLDSSPLIKTYWCRRFNFYECTVQPTFVLRSKNPLPIFDTEDTTDRNVPGPYDNYTMGMYKKSIVHLENFTGYKNSAQNKMPHCHTMIITSVKRKAEERVYQGLVAMFTQLVAQAMDNGYKMGEHLKKPLMAKCIIFTELTMTLMCFQLNTLSLQEESGIKNIAWEKQMPMFNSGVRETRTNFVVLDKLLLDEEIEMNEECFDAFVRFVTQETEQ